ncbi:hypothetical protein SNE40_010923 [Patella caerulea]|uniref:Uncharacterized protein n=1 Tax=Patella caerulea TaxID=87958 RepID=A0AAN8JVB1_PATCE
MDGETIAWIVIIAILGFLLLITCGISAVKAVKDRKRIKATIAAKQAARIILNKPSARTMGRQTSRSSDDVLSPVGSSGSGLIAERMRSEEQRRQLSKSPTRRPFDPVISDWRSENRLDRRQYLERCIRRQLEPDQDFDYRRGMELQHQPDWTENGRRRKHHINSDPYYEYFSTASNDKLYVERRWDGDGGRGSRSRSDIEIHPPPKDKIYRLQSAPYDYRNGRSQSVSNGHRGRDTGVYRSRSEDYLSRTSSRLSVRRGSYAAAIENEDDFSRSLGYLGRTSSFGKSERSITVYPCNRNGNIGMENRAYVKSDDILRQVSL